MLASVIDQQIRQAGVKVFLDDPVKERLINNELVDAQSGRTFEVVNDDPSRSSPTRRRPTRPTSMQPSAPHARRSAVRGHAVSIHGAASGSLPWRRSRGGLPARRAGLITCGMS